MSDSEPAHGDERRVSDALQVVSFRLDGEDYAIEITKVKEIILITEITRVPQMPAFIEGVINLRGTVIPVIDLRTRFGLPRTTRDEHHRIVVTRMEGRIVGLIVDAVSQVLKIPRNDIQDPPDTIAGLAGAYLTGIAKHQDRMLICLDIERILSADERTSLS